MLDREKVMTALVEKLRNESRFGEPMHMEDLVVKKQVNFFVLKHHPKALRFEMWVEHERKFRGIVPLRMVTAHQAEGKNLVVALTDPFYPPEKALPENAIYWLVNKARLDLPEDAENDLFDALECVDYDNPNLTPIYKSNWDGTVWDIEGEPILMPQVFSLWGTRFDLPKVGEHLSKHPAVTSFEIEPNRCSQNWNISGRELGRLVVDFRKLDRARLENLSNRWFDDHVIKGYRGLADVQHDIFDLGPFRRNPW